MALKNQFIFNGFFITHITFVMAIKNPGIIFFMAIKNTAGAQVF